MMMWGHGWGAMMLGGLLMLLFWGALIALAVLAIRALTRPIDRSSSVSSGPSYAGGDRALDILRERYAKGEITKAEYEEMRAELRN